YFNKYGNCLFGHPVIRDDDGTVIAVVERTNNVAEHFFGEEKQSGDSATTVDEAEVRAIGGFARYVHMI
ncbi:MAG: hypothetical protein U9R05_06250, partial [Chloroflexota bacterium]|nr:hypothetical protein [Chloroflexota bacterium]